MLYGFGACVGAVGNGLERAMLCAAETASSTASGGCEAWEGERGCLACSLGHGEAVGTGCGRGAACAHVSGAVLWRMLGMVDSGTGAAFMAALAAIREAELVERGR